MTVFLLLYLCADASRTDCQVVEADSWSGPHAYEQCTDVVPGLTEALTSPNRKRHQFVCEIQGAMAKPAEHEAQPAFIHQSFRM
ncbi:MULTISPECIES: hypothetical protein [Pseudomonas]|uniref:hypothetical protein n=1 Tax=Pseudomonas TaxID=286 RepID=UPI000357A2AD|nr:MULTISPECIES: hypothetical protein [Pseudomonas]EPJ82454.1 hypothetical protein CFT9_16277 [Pseudomonas sp. CFT9]MBK3450083.1 hypothetical protein [Pseudomonas haemolytica]OKP74706.1 hypothetical protein BTR19_00315 [Pseudomonas fluorescens]